MPVLVAYGLWWWYNYVPSNFVTYPEFGIGIPDGVTYDFGAVMSRMRRLRARISHNDSAHRYAKLGVDVFIGHGAFIQRRQEPRITLQPTLPYCKGQ